MTVPPNIRHEITCKFTSLLDFAQPRAILPLNSLTFSKTLNTPGTWNGSLNVEDPAVRRSDWQYATAVNRSAMWVDIDGVLVYGGYTTADPYQMSTGNVNLSGVDFGGYLSQRIQGWGYANYTDPEGHNWITSPGVSALRLGYYVLKDALEKAYSIPIKVATDGSPPATTFWLTFSAPEDQQQSVASVLSQVQQLGYLIGIDYSCDVAYVGGVPTATITLSYPRRGKTLNPWIIDLSAVLDLEYGGDGTQQADRIVEMAGATITRSSTGVYLPAREAGYPLFEAQISHTALAPTEDSAAVLEAYVGGSLAMRAYPLTAPVVTLPMFGSPSILELDVGDDVILRVPKGAGNLPANNPRFPEGGDFLFRIVRIDATVPNEGVPTMALTLNIPPSVLPVEPPELSNEGREAKGIEEREKQAEREKEKVEEEEAKEKEAKEKAEAEAEAAKILAEEAATKAGEAEAEALAAQKQAEEEGNAALAARRAKEAEEAAAAKAAAELAKAEAKRAKKEAKERRSQQAKERAEKAKAHAEELKRKNEEIAETKTHEEERKTEITETKEAITKVGLSGPFEVKTTRENAVEYLASAESDALVVLSQEVPGGKGFNGVYVNGVLIVNSSGEENPRSVTIPVPKGQKWIAYAVGTASYHAAVWLI